MSDKLKPDPEALEAWEKLPKNAPSKDALPPATSGMPPWLWWLIGLTLAIGILAIILQS